jgi:hypothetical protein
MFRRLSPHGSVSRDLVAPTIASVLLSENALVAQRKFYQFKRGSFPLSSSLPPPKLNLFLSADDVQSFVLLQCTIKMMARYNCQVKLYLLPVGVNGWSASTEEKYGWNNRDAGLFSAYYSLEEPHFHASITENTAVNSTDCEHVTSLLGDLLRPSNAASGSPAAHHDVETVTKALNYLKLIWSKDSSDQVLPPSSPLPVDQEQLKKNQLLLTKLGFYNPGAIELEGEWYPPGRLHHLERRLLAEG